MSKGSILGGSFLILLILSSCDKKQEQAPVIPEDYASWERTTGRVLNYPIPGHESNLRRIYINEKGRQPTVETRGNRVYYGFPVGTIIVKEIYGGLTPPEGEPPHTLTVMIKQPENPRSRGGWLWLTQKVETGEQQIFDYEFCVVCHANANEPHPYGNKNPGGDFRDYVFFPPE